LAESRLRRFQRNIAPFPPAKGVAFAGCASKLAESPHGAFSGHRTFAAGQRRGFDPLRLVSWLKAPAALSAKHHTFPAGKSVAFAGRTSSVG